MAFVYFAAACLVLVLAGRKAPAAFRLAGKHPVIGSIGGGVVMIAAFLLLRAAGSAEVVEQRGVSVQQGEAVAPAAATSKHHTLGDAVKGMLSIHSSPQRPE